MKIIFSFILFLLFASGCKTPPGQKESQENSNQKETIRFYSQSTKDTFSIFISLPKDSVKDENNRYPVVYLLDANLFFDHVATTMDESSKTGLLPPVILVGIGYKDLMEMDSLRSRDYTYPIAFAQYDMELSGGAKQFLTFLQSELIPLIDHKFKTDTIHRILMGHSLGGFFSLFALLENASGNNESFSSFIAASPSLHYDNYYLLNRLNELASFTLIEPKIKTYLTFGELEDEEDSDDESDSTVMKTIEVEDSLTKIFSRKRSGKIIYKSDLYPNLGHMETAIPTFIKGLQWIFYD